MDETRKETKDIEGPWGTHNMYRKLNILDGFMLVFDGLLDPLIKELRDQGPYGKLQEKEE